MSYTRWGPGHNWFVFWWSSRPYPTNKEDEMLAIWNCEVDPSVEENTPKYTYSEVNEMLKTKDLSRIKHSDKIGNDFELLISCMEEFINDVDAEYAKPKPFDWRAK